MGHARAILGRLGKEKRITTGASTLSRKKKRIITGASTLSGGGCAGRGGVGRAVVVPGIARWQRLAIEQILARGRRVGGRARLLEAHVVLAGARRQLRIPGIVVEDQIHGEGAVGFDGLTRDAQVAIAQGAKPVITGREVQRGSKKYELTSSSRRTSAALVVLFVCVWRLLSFATQRCFLLPQTFNFWNEHSAQRGLFQTTVTTLMAPPTPILAVGAPQWSYGLTPG